MEWLEHYWVLCFQLKLHRTLWDAGRKCATSISNYLAEMTRYKATFLGKISGMI